MTAQNHLEQLEAEARYHRERLALYRARVYSGRPMTAGRLQELQRASDLAEQRIRRLSEASPAPDAPPT